MKKAICGLFLLISLLVACAPQAPSATPAPTAPATPTPLIAPVRATPSPEDIVWAKVVEAAKKESTLTIYSYSWVGEAGIGLTKAFADSFGIKVEIITGRGAEFVERMKTEQRVGQVSGDIMEGATTHLGLAKAAGVLVPRAQELPAVKEKGVWNIDPLFADPEGYFFPVISTIGPPWVNTKLVKPEEEPKSWHELIEPKWKGKIMLQDPAVSTGAYRLLALVRYNVVNEDFMRQLGEQEPRFTTGLYEEVQLLARGERPLSVFNDVSAAAVSIEQGAPIKAVSMKEGVVAWPIVAGCVKNSQHPNAAKVFLNWMLTQEGQSINSRLKHIPSVRKDVADFSPAAARVNTRLLVLTPAMLEEQTKLFGEKYLVKLWKK